MSIRRATRGDIRAMAEVAAAAFIDEELVGTLMHPYRKEHPEDFIVFFECKILSGWYNPNHVYVVGIDKDSGKVIGAAMWERQGASASSSWSKYMSPGNLMSTVIPYYLRAYGWMWPNRAADMTKINILEETFPLFRELWSGSREQNWFLDFIATHPDFQGQGIGKKLVQWGVALAEKENICSSLISAIGRETFYNQFGFVEVGRANVGLLKENGIKGGAVMFREVASS